MLFKNWKNVVWKHKPNGPLVFKHMFSVFKQHYTYFHILFYLHVFLKNTNNITRTTLSNALKYYMLFIYTVFAFFVRVNNLSLVNIEFF